MRPWRSFLVVAVLGCSRSPDSAPPVVAVEPVGSVRPASSGSAAPVAPVAQEDAACADGFVDIEDAGKTVRYQLGREIVPGKRGATHAFAEEIIHPNGELVFSVTALAKADGHEGNVSIVVTGFKEPTPPAAYETARVIYMPPGLTAERDERWLEGARVEITKWGPEGSFIEGTFEPGAPSAAVPVPTISPRASASASAPARPRASASASAFVAPPRPPKRPYRGRFRVCRTADWRSRL